ncbi:alpha/beta fold hydrolase [Paucihalobacter sp.]|uniref:alpha/beta fold hydrolase n=1 Tax=Paucihalobacter sp. TaxID=2850405 RepID=UPI002FE0AB11
MFKNYFWGICLLGLSLQAQVSIMQLDVNFNTSEMNTKILLSPTLTQADLLNSDNLEFSTFRFIQAWQELGSVDFERRFKPAATLLDARKNSLVDALIPIGIILTEFDIIKSTALTNQEVYIENQTLKRSPSASNIFETRQLFASAPLNEKHKGLQTSFIINRDFVINTTNAELTEIQIDFGDGNGFRMVGIGDIVNIHYQNAGLKTLQIKATLNNSAEMISSSSIKISLNRDEQNLRNTSRNTSEILPITASNIVDLSAYGETSNEPGQGEYEIFFDTVDGVLDKPIIVVDGFDPGDTRDIPGIYNLLNYQDPVNGAQNLADLVRAEGFDVIILNAPQYVSNSIPIDGGGDYMERNAMVLVELIETINAQKVGSEELVIIGPSMGGLISRYALNFMENNGLAHETRLWMSFDSPHLGANVPIGFQHQFNFLAFGLNLGGVLGNQNVVALQPLVEDLLKSSAARQLLVDHFESHLADGSAVNFNPALLNPDPHPFRAIFQNNINALTATGFPENTRNVTIINGSGIGNPYFALGNSGPTVTNGYSVINTSINVAILTNINLLVSLTPAATVNQQVSGVSIVSFFNTIVSSSANSQSFSFTDGVDAAPGGLFDLSGLTGAIELTGIAADFVNSLAIDKFNFIPAVSALAMTVTNNEIDWFHNIDLGTPSGRAVLDETPFDNWFLPDDNEPHVQLTEANVIFALEEIIPSTLSVNTELANGFKLNNNPVSTVLKFTSNNTLENNQLIVTDITGKQVFEINNISISNETSIPIDLNNGLYILSIQNPDGFNYINKIIINK